MERRAFFRNFAIGGSLLLSAQLILIHVQTMIWEMKQIELRLI